MNVNHLWVGIKRVNSGRSSSVNPVTYKSDHHLISPHDITPESNLRSYA